jgi:hypothetical protein
MHSHSWSMLIPFFFIGVFAVSKIMNTWIRAKHGYPLEDRRRRGDDASADDVAGHVKYALKNRDETIAKLEERVRVLERIVTDDSKRISDEIDALRTV